MTDTTFTPTSAFCQNCGRALTDTEVRNVNGRIFCGPCAVAAANPAATGIPYGYPPPPYAAAGMTHSPSPVIAGLLGFIPGVGAMYNGQFVKGLVHILIFIGLISAASNINGLFGLLIAGWVFYQVFDAVQTANAIRMGLPLPDPLGLNGIGAKLGFGQHAPGWTPPPTGTSNVPPVAPVPPLPAGIVPYATPSEATENAAYPGAAQTPYAAPPPPPYPPMPPARKSLPVGAVVLIGLGALFLLNTFDVLRANWIGHGWPLILIALGIWLLYRATRGNRNGGLE